MHLLLVSWLAFNVLIPPVPAARTDARGDALPESAVARLGTTRLRHGHRVEGLAFAADGKSIYAATTYGGVTVWDATTGRTVHQLPSSANHCQALALAPDGRTLAVAYGYGVVELWDTKTNTKRLSLPKESYHAGHVTFSHDGKLLAVATGDTVRLWNVAKEEWQDHLKEVTGISAVAFSADDRVLALALKERLCLWDITKREEIRHLRDGDVKHGVQLRGLFAPKGDTLAVWGYDDGSVRLFNATGEHERHRIALPAKASAQSAWGWASSIGVQFSPDGKTIALFRNDRPNTLAKIELRDVATGKLRHELPCEPLHTPLLLRFSPDGKTLVSGGGAAWQGDHAVHLWDVTTGREVLTAPSHGGPIVALAISSDGQRTATGSKDGLVHVWETRTGKHVLRLVLDGYWPEVQFSHDGERLLAWADKELRIVELRTGKELAKHTLKGKQQTWSSIHPNEQTAYSVDAEKRIARAHDLRTNKIIHEDTSDYFHHHSPHRFAPDGNITATRGGPLYSLRDRKEVYKTAMFGSGGAFSADSRYYATTAVPQRPGVELLGDPPFEEVALIDLHTKRERRLGQLYNEKRHAKHIDAVTISGDGQMIATAHSGDMNAPMLTLWERETGLERGHFVGHRGRVNRLAFTPDGRYLVTASDDTTALVWDLHAARRRTPSPKAATFPMHLASLALTNGEDVHAAQMAFRADPLAGLRVLREYEALWKPAEAKQLQGWIADLDSDRFAVRETATKELHAALDEAEPHLRKALTAKGSTEFRQRVEQLLASRQSGRTGRELQRLRVLEVLEYLANKTTAKHRPEALELLKRFPTSFPDSFIGQEAQAALARIDKR